MTKQSTKWLASMVKRYGSEEAVREEMRRRQAKSRANPNTRKGGFAYLKEHDPDKLKNIRWHKELLNNDAEI